jgi:hypothetical protein
MWDDPAVKGSAPAVLRTPRGRHEGMISVQQQSPTRDHRAPVVIDPDGHVSHYLTRRTRQLIETRQVRPWSIDGMGIRERRDLLAAGRRFPAPTHMRGTVGGHRVELYTDTYGVALGTCDCEASRWGRVCCHLLAFATVAVVEFGWTAA